MPIDLKDPDWRFLFHPIVEDMVSYHPQAAIAFKSSKTGFVIDTHLLYAYIAGGWPTWLASMILPLYSGEDVPPRSGERNEKVPISERAVRSKLASWREVLSSDSRYIQHVGMRLLAKSHCGNLIQHEFLPLYRMVLTKGMFQGLTEAQLEEREKYWDRVKECIDACPVGLTKSQFVSALNGKGTYQSAMVLWREFLGERSMATGFTEWLIEHHERMGQTFDHAEKSCQLRSNCSYCDLPEISKAQPVVLQSIFENPSFYRLQRSEDFYGQFVIAVFSAMVKLQVIADLYGIQRSVETGLAMGDSDKPNLAVQARVVARDRMRLINQVSFAAVDCLLHKKTGDGKYLMTTLTEPEHPERSVGVEPDSSA